jgi:hypothetical protein
MAGRSALDELFVYAGTLKKPFQPLEGGDCGAHALASRLTLRT